jgi:hypothetical protein
MDSKNFTSSNLRGFLAPKERGGWMRPGLMGRDQLMGVSEMTVKALASNLGGKPHRQGTRFVATTKLQSLGRQDGIYVD